MHFFVFSTVLPKLKPIIITHEQISSSNKVKKYNFSHVL